MELALKSQYRAQVWKKVENMSICAPSYAILENQPGEWRNQKMARSATDDIGLMTLAAAHEVDLRLAGAKPNTDVFLALRQHLSEISELTDRSSVAFLHSDPRAIQILARALEESTQTEIKNVSMLLDQIKDVTQPLRSEKPELDEQRLNKFKQFCLSLHRAVSATEVPSFHEWEYSPDGEVAFS